MKPAHTAAALCAASLLAAGPSAQAAAAASTPQAEARAHALFRQVRCLVCQNESIDDSDAELAADLRALVRGEIAAGRSDAEIRRDLTRRYGEFVLLRPRVSAANGLLWGAPFLIVLVGLGAFALHARGGRREADLPLSADERARIAALQPTVTLQPHPGPMDTTEPR